MDQKKLLEMWGYPQEEVTPLVQKPTQVVSAPMAPAPEMTPPVFETPAMPAESNEMNPQVKDYLMQKFNLGEFSEDARKQITEENAKPDYGNRGMAALAAIGAGMMGRDPTAAGNAILERQKQQGRQKLEDFDKGRANKIQQYTLDRELKKDSRDDDLFKRESDPESQESKLADSLAREMGYTGGPITATQFKGFSPVMAKKYEIAEKKLDRQDARAERRSLFGLKTEEKKEAREEKKKTALNEVEDRRRNIEDNLTLLEKQIDEDGTYEVFGSHNTDLNRRVDMIATDMAKLADPNSVARPSEVELFKQGLIQANMAEMTNETAKKILQNFRKEVDSRAKNAYKIRNLENPGTQQERSGGTSSSNEVERLDKKTGKTVIFDANTKQFLRFK